MGRWKAIFTMMVSTQLALAVPTATAQDGLGAWAKTAMIDRNLPIKTVVDPGLNTHSFIMPAGLNKARALPIVMWENGGCAWNSYQSASVLLERIASSGAVVMARGGAGYVGPSPSPSPANLAVYNAYVQQMKAQQISALNWLLAENDRPGSEFFKRLDPGKIVATGFSCGGYLGFENSLIDDRIKSVVFFNSSPDPRWTPAQVTAAFAQTDIPLAMFDGGPSDVAYAAALADWNLLPSHVPGIFANWAGAGHGGFWSTNGKVLYQPKLAEWTIHWIDYTVVSGNEESRQALLGTPCVICTTQAITSLQKNWSAFDAPEGPNNTGQANKGAPPASGTDFGVRTPPRN